MATKSLFSDMLNQKPISSVAMKAKGVKVKKPPGAAQFAILDGGNLYRRSMENNGNDVSKSVWARALNAKKGGR